MLRVALTGGIASGKSAAAAAFRDLGVPVIDTDETARKVVEAGRTGLNALVDALGEDILTASGELDRAKLRDRIFNDNALRQRVNGILHPLILADVDRRIAALERDASFPYALVEVPLLAEAGLADRFDRVVVVDVPESVQVRRLQSRDAATQEQAFAALAAQASRRQRLDVATDVLDNAGSFDVLRKRVSELHARFMKLAERFATPPGRPAE